MSKKSRRRARRARERAAFDPRAVREAFGHISVLASRMPAVMDLFAKTMADGLKVFALTIDRVGVVASALHTEWREVVADAIRRGDSLPVLAFADWLEERCRAAESQRAWRVADGLAG